MKKSFVIVLVVCGCVAVAMAGTYTAVSSYQAPNMVSEVNTALGQLDSSIDALEGGTSTVTQEANTLLVGNSSSNQVAMPVTGDVTITQDGTNATTAIASGVIVNDDVKTNAAIALSKLANSVVITTITNVVGSVTNTYSVLTATP